MSKQVKEWEKKLSIQLKNAKKIYEEKKYEEALKIFGEIKKMRGSLMWIGMNYRMFFVPYGMCLFKLGRTYEAFEAVCLAFKNVPHDEELLESLEDLLSSPQIHNFMEEKSSDKTCINIISRVNEPKERGRLFLLLYILKNGSHDYAEEEKMKQHLVDQLQILIPKDKDVIELVRKRKQNSYLKIYNAGVAVLESRYFEATLGNFYYTLTLKYGTPEGISSKKDIKKIEKKILKLLKNAEKKYNEAKYEEALTILDEVEKIRGYLIWIAMNYRKFFVPYGMCLFKLGRFLEAFAVISPAFKKVPHDNKLLESLKELLSSPQIFEFVEKNSVNNHYKNIIRNANDPLERGRLFLLLCILSNSKSGKKKMKQYLMNQLKILAPKDKDLIIEFKQRKQDNYEQIYDEGTKLLESGKFSQALDRFYKALNLNKTDPDLLTNIGSANFYIQKYEEALKYLNLSLKQDPTNPIPLLLKGILFTEIIEFEKAIECFELILRNNPSFTQARSVLYTAKKHLDVYNGIKSGVNEIPNYLREDFKRGMSLVFQNKFDEASNKFSLLQKRSDVEFAEIYLFQGIIQMENENYRSAIIRFNKATTIKPKLTYAWTQMGVAYDYLNDYDKAIECYDKAIDIDSQISGPWNNKGLAYDALKNYEKAIKCFDKAIEINPDYTENWFNKGESLRKFCENIEDIDTRNKYLSNAISCYKKALGLNPYLEIAQVRIDQLSVKIVSIEDGRSV